MLLENHQVMKISDLPAAHFFKKIAGYDTLRMILCKKAILVEGDSDELIVQKAYMKMHNGKLPIQDQSKSKLYVAITRAMYSVGIVFDNKKKIEIEGICQYRAD